MPKGLDMNLVDPEIIEQLKTFDSPTVFNALVRKYGLPNEEYTDHTIRCLLPELGTVVGYAVTSEVTTNDADSSALVWADYYEYLEQAQGPLIAVMKDVDSRPGRGASFGDGMATLHQRLGVVGAIVDGTVRDLAGIQRVGLPMWAWVKISQRGFSAMIVSASSACSKPHSTASRKASSPKTFNDIHSLRPRNPRVS